MSGKRPGLQLLCFERQPPRVSNKIWDNYTPPTDWQAKFANFIFTNLTTDTINSFNDGHTIRLATLNDITVKVKKQCERPRLNTLLKQFYGILSGEVEDPSMFFDQKTDLCAISEKLWEGFLQCLEGSEDRAAVIWRCFSFSATLPDMLQKVRNDLVFEVAQLLYTEVHASKS